MFETDPRGVFVGPADGPGQAPGPGADLEPRWTPSSALVALFGAIFASLLVAAALAGIFVAAGADSDHLDSSPGFTLTGTLFQDLLFVVAALVTASQFSRPTAAQFGFRRVGLSALGWAALAFAAFIVAAQVYGSLIHIPKDDLPFAENPSTAVAIATGIFVIGIAPTVEEFFFRGFLYQGLRGRLGVALGALTSGVIFGAVHLEAPAQMGVLAILGVILALLFERTKSLWPCILLHAINNAIAFQYVMTH